MKAYKNAWIEKLTNKVPNKEILDLIGVSCVNISKVIHFPSEKIVVFWDIGIFTIYLYVGLNFITIPALQY